MTSLRSDILVSLSRRNSEPPPGHVMVILTDAKTVWSGFADWGEDGGLYRIEPSRLRISDYNRILTGFYLREEEIRTWLQSEGLSLPERRGDGALFGLLAALGSKKRRTLQRIAELISKGACPVVYGFCANGALQRSTVCALGK